MNPLSDRLQTGTLGELLVQLRLLQYDVQAAAPLKDTGNDLIAVRGPILKAIQVKTTKGQRPRIDVLEQRYHIHAFVILEGEGRELHLDSCPVFLVPAEEVEALRSDRRNLDQYMISEALVDRLFPRPEVVIAPPAAGQPASARTLLRP